MKYKAVISINTHNDEPLEEERTFATKAEAEAWTQGVSDTRAFGFDDYEWEETVTLKIVKVA